MYKRQELDEMVHKIRDENKKLVEELSNQQSNKNELEVQLLDNFFIEIVSTIDRVYNLIISRQLGG